MYLFTFYRNSRRIGEKLRRDRLNNFIGALSKEIPWVAEAEHRLDKSQILSLTVNYLKLHLGKFCSTQLNLAEKRFSYRVKEERRW